jgi:hypothetical protein
MPSHALMTSHALQAFRVASKTYTHTTKVINKLRPAFLQLVATPEAQKQILQSGRLSDFSDVSRSFIIPRGMVEGAWVHAPLTPLGWLKTPIGCCDILIDLLYLDAVTPHSNTGRNSVTRMYAQCPQMMLITLNMLFCYKIVDMDALVEWIFVKQTVKERWLVSVFPFSP